MENQTETKKPFPIVIIFPILLVILLIAVAFFIYKKNLVKNEGAVSTSIAPSVAPSIALVKGSLTLLPNPSKKPLVAGETIYLNVSADSSNSSITGYDVVVKYDPSVVSYVSQKNLLSDFQVFAQNDNGKLSLTGIKKISVTSTVTFQNTVISELTFKALKSGKASFEIEFLPGSKKDSNLIDDKNNDVLGTVNGVEITVDVK
ncbi:MAG: hypothetical protein HYW86_05110 [Candidatus Roizmanbacteria bacterium]|nr:MAG: hypothetical protein HYW86_05110 [Candidatus Roizmanbacteria bacterium]